MVRKLGSANEGENVFIIKKGIIQKRNVLRKSFSGCLNCKRKKKKCDEVKPICSRCAKGKSSCIWPEFCNVDPSISFSKGENRTKNKAIVKAKSDSVFESVPSRMISSSLRIEEPKQLIFSPIEATSFNIPLSLGNNEGQCFVYFLEKFLPSISHPFAHDYSLEGIFISAASESSALRDIFIACGATIIAFENEKFKEVSHYCYLKAIKSLVEEIKNGGKASSQDWFFMAVQILQIRCFRENFICLPAATVIPHITAACQIIEHRFSGRSNRTEPLTGSMEIYEGRRSFTQNRKYYSPLDRALVENFLFNYPIAIFFGRSDKLENKVPNPFEFFGIHDFWKTFDNFETENKVNRLSKYAFEIAAKSLWICRLKLPLDNVHQIICKKLHNDDCKLIEDFNALDVSILNKATKQAVSIGKIAALISSILLRKMIYLNILHAHDFQKEVNEIMAEISKHYNESLILPGWTLLIATCASIQADQRAFFRGQFDKLLLNLKSNMLSQIIDFVDSTYEFSNAEAFEFVFDTKIIDMICS